MQQQIEEIDFIASQLVHEVEALATSGYPTVHWFLIEGLTKSLVQRAARVNILANNTLLEITAIATMTVDCSYTDDQAS